ncbi:hypothetical protein Mic7113_4199 [Allocoleopsis franciscana PCC 7113]|uniref:Uncharacterized protein n=1 Tax=Allocoleopsis franciscana PCC 7113 TaxID=1173027 RepID=K9WHK8_9CYAN|nr:hypothetical protein Mic7113_4199 [Allocoleopsis franciscana PCC 7113]
MMITPLSANLGATIPTIEQNFFLYHFWLQGNGY